MATNWDSNDKAISSMGEGEGEGDYEYVFDNHVRLSEISSHEVNNSPINESPCAVRLNLSFLASISLTSGTKIVSEIQFRRFIVHCIKSSSLTL